MTLNERAAYLKGLADGLELDAGTKEGKILSALLELVGEMATEITDMGEDIEYLNDYVEELDEDLGEVEELLMDEDDCDECDGDCDCCDLDCDCEELDDSEYFEVECPSCGRTVCFDESIDPEELICPACGEKFECLIAEEDLQELDGQ